VVKVIVDRGVDGGEFLQGLDVPGHRRSLSQDQEPAKDQQHEQDRQQPPLVLSLKSD